MGNFGRKHECCMEPLDIFEECVEVPISRYEELIRRETELNILEAVFNNGEGRYRVEEVFNAIKKVRDQLSPAAMLCVEMKVEGAEKSAEQNHHHGAPDTRPGAASDR